MLGAMLDKGLCRFRVWSPRSLEVTIALEDHPQSRVPMKASGDGYHVAELEGIVAGQLYRYEIEGDLLPDPCSRFQPEGPHGPSEVVDLNAYRWRDGTWKGIRLEGTVLYELHIGTFTREGTFSAAATRLRHLRSLGVSAVEIMPVAECPGAFNWGYDGVGWFAPSHNYGPYDALKFFVDAAHAEGIGVILDVVYNHFGPDGNYTSRFSPHYFGTKSTEWGEAINFDGDHSGPVREMVIANACEWIREFHVDGLRLDATQSIHDSGSLHVLAELAAAARLAAGDRDILVIAENEQQVATHLLPVSAGGLGLDAMWNDDFHHAAMVAATGRREAYYLDYLGSPQEFVSTARHGFLFQGQFYRWQNKPRGEPLKSAVNRCVAYLQNHDQVANTRAGLRLHQMTSPAMCRALTAVLLLGPQTPLLFMGQEFQASAPFLFFADHSGGLREAVREGRREFLAQFPGPASRDGADSLADPGDESTFQSSRLDWNECTDSNPALHLHQDLIHLRREDPVISHQGAGGFDGAVLAEDAFALRWHHPAEGDRLLVVNFGVDVTHRPMPEPLLAPPPGRRWSLKWSSEHARYGGTGSVDPQPDRGWRLPAQCAMLLVASVADGTAP
jgi:maltooligosyltrehalose trehalohydrolase